MRNHLVYLVGTILVRASSIILLPIFTRSLTPSDYGALELLNRATDILLLCLFLNGTCLAAITFYNQARSEEARRRVVGSTLLLGYSLLGVIGLGSLALAGPVGAWIGVSDPGLIRLAALSALGDAAFTICLALTQARIQAMRFVAVTMLHLTIRVALIVAFLCLLGLGVRGVLLASLITSWTLAISLTASEVVRFGLLFDRRTIGGLTRFALPFLPGGLCGFVLGTGDQFLLARHATIADVGLYALGYKLAMMVGTLSRDPLMRVWGARMHQVADEADAPRIFGRVFTGFAGSYLLPGLGLALFSREAISLLAEARYLDAALYIPPLVLAYFFMGAADLMDAAFYTSRRSQVKLGITLATTAVTMALYLLLIPPYGGRGAAWATLGGFMFRASLTYIVSQRLFRVDYEWARVAAMLVSAIGCWSLAQFVSGPAWATVPVKAAILGLFPATLWMSGQVAREEKQALYALLDRLRRAVGSRWRSVYSAVRET